MADSSWKRMAIAPDRPIVDAMRVIEAASESIVLVLGADGRLLGTVTDGDVRRAILRGVPLSEPVSDIMNGRPITAGAATGREHAIALMNRHAVRYLPVVDGDGRVCDLLILHDLIAPPERDNWVVLMAGGEGQRLRPLTETCPKPMIRVGGRPILEVIVQSFVDQGFRRFFLAVNYMAGVIRDHFGDGSRWQAEIRYLYEDAKLGTAGALSLLPERPGKPFFVMNGDLLTRIDFPSMLEFHGASGYAATLGVREYTTRLPFGVVTLDHDRVTAITEKPTQSHFINAGVYVLDSSSVDLVRPREPLDMPALLGRMIEGRRTVGSFPIHEYWIDIGRVSDLEQAHQDYEQFFR